MHDTKERLSLLWVFALLNLFFATIETVCTWAIIWQAWIWSEGSQQFVRSGSPANRKLGSLLLSYWIAQNCRCSYT